MPEPKSDAKDAKDAKDSSGSSGQTAAPSAPRDGGPSLSSDALARREEEVAAKDNDKEGPVSKATPKEKAPTCPVCGAALEPYVGHNEHKQGTGFCRACGVRRPLAVALTDQDREHGRAV